MLAQQATHAVRARLEVDAPLQNAARRVPVRHATPQTRGGRVQCAIRTTTQHGAVDEHAGNDVAALADENRVQQGAVLDAGGGTNHTPILSDGLKNGLDALLQ